VAAASPGRDKESRVENGKLAKKIKNVDWPQVDTKSKFMTKKVQKLVGTKEESEHKDLENSTCNGRKSKPGTPGNTIRGHHSLGAIFLGSWRDLMVETC